MNAAARVYSPHYEKHVDMQYLQTSGVHTTASIHRRMARAMCGVPPPSPRAWMGSSSVRRLPVYAYPRTVYGLSSWMGISSSCHGRAIAELMFRSLMMKSGLYHHPAE